MSNHPKAEGGPAKILIVDDERDIVEYLCMALEDAGFRATGLTETRAALEWIEAEQPDTGPCVRARRPAESPWSSSADTRAETIS
jgi:PleD family two-component response regulator